MRLNSNIKIAMILMLLIWSCNKSTEEYMGEGVITGFDERDCACCGGLLINLNSISTELYTDSTYQIDQVPADFYIDASSGFPVFIELDYSRNDKLCGKTIDITRFKRK